MAVIKVGDVSIILEEEGDRVVVHSNRGDGFERRSLGAWKALMRPGMLAVDIGAYTGVYSILAAKMGANILAFEPFPNNAKRLKHNFAQNRMGNYSISNAALSDREGMAEFGYNPAVRLTSGGSLEGVRSAGEVIHVKTFPLDAFALTGICAIKIDVERHEPAVIRGGLTTIRRERPPLLVETLDAEMRKQVADLLPNYLEGEVLDGRNTLFFPR